MNFVPDRFERLDNGTRLSDAVIFTAEDFGDQLSLRCLVLDQQH